MKISNLIILWILPLLMVIAGLCGNLIGFFVFSEKKASKFPPRNIFRALAIFDTIYLLSISFDYFILNMGHGFLKQTNHLCLFAKYITFALAPISAWLLVYITIDKLVAISFLIYAKSIKFKIIQNLVICLIIAYNLIYYLPIFVLIAIDLDSENKTKSNEIFLCSVENKRLINFLFQMDLYNLLVLPFISLITVSLILFGIIAKSRFQIRKLYLRQRLKKRFYKEINFAISSILMNFTFVFLNLPLCIGNILNIKETEFIYKINYLFFSASFCVKFYILLASNSIFRNEVKNIFNSNRKN